MPTGRAVCSLERRLTLSPVLGLHIVFLSNRDNLTLLLLARPGTRVFLIGQLFSAVSLLLIRSSLTNYQFNGSIVLSDIRNYVKQEKRLNPVLREQLARPLKNR